MEAGARRSLATLSARHRDWGGTPLPLLTVYGSQASLSLVSSWDVLRLQPHQIAPFEHIENRTGGHLVPDPRKPRYADLPPLVGDLPETAPRRYEVWTLAAQHGTAEEEAMLFVIQQVEGPEVDGQSRHPALLYAIDTGPFPAETWASLEELGRTGLRLTVAVLDATLGVARDQHGSMDHMTLEQVIFQRQELERRCLLTDDCRALAHHFSHYFTPAEDQLEALLAPHGIHPTYDGLTLCS